MLKPLRRALWLHAQLLSRRCATAALYHLPPPTPERSGRPRTDGERLGNAGSLAVTLQPSAQVYSLSLTVSGSAAYKAPWR